MKMKLKSIPKNIAIHTPTESEAKQLFRILHKNGYKWCNDEKLSKTEWGTYGENTCYCFEYKKIAFTHRPWFVSNGYSILTFAEFKERYCEQEEPCIKELDLCELLKGHEGEEFFSLAYGVVVLNKIRFSTQRGDSTNFLLVRPTSYDSGTIIVHSNGKLKTAGVVDLVPSHALYEQYPLDPYTAWMEWLKEQKKYILSIQLHKINLDGTCGVYDMAARYAFRTTADRDKCIEEIKAVIEKYSK